MPRARSTRLCASSTSTATRQRFASASLGGTIKIRDPSTGKDVQTLHGFGGMMALIEQKISGRMGNVNPLLYALANNAAYYTPGATILTNSNVVFNDITSGDNKMPCSAGTPDCSRTGGSMGFSATNGYDLATGWGSINGKALLGSDVTITLGFTYNALVNNFGVNFLIVPNIVQAIAPGLFGGPASPMTRR